MHPPAAGVNTVDRVGAGVHDPLVMAGCEHAVGVCVRELPGHQVPVMARPAEVAMTDVRNARPVTIARALDQPAELGPGSRREADRKRARRRHDVLRPRLDAVDAVSAEHRDTVDAGGKRAVRAGRRDQPGDDAPHPVTSDPHDADLARPTNAGLALLTTADAVAAAVTGLGHI